MAFVITPDQVADLNDGDVVELLDNEHPGVVTRGPIKVRFRDDGHRRVSLGPWILGGNPTGWNLTVVSRAPVPLYVNHPRTEPKAGDVVRTAVGEQWTSVWICDPDGDWWTPTDGRLRRWERQHMPPRLRLLVDGETGQVVSS